MHTVPSAKYNYILPLLFKKVSAILMLGITSLLFLKLKNKTKYLIYGSFKTLCQSAHVLLNSPGNCILISPLPFFRTNEIHRTALPAICCTQQLPFKVLDHRA